MRVLMFALLAGLLVFSSCPNDPEEADPFIRSVPEDFMGMVHAGSRYDKEAEEYALLDDLGVTWMLKDFSWSSIQPGKNTWNLGAFDEYVDNGKEHGRKIIALLDYDVGWLHDGTYEDDRFTDGKSHDYISESEISIFCKYVKRTVAWYAGRVDAWCIWNEPNLTRFWNGTKEEFFALTKAAAQTIRETDPNVVIVGGALNTLASKEWVQGLFRSGAMEQVDVVAYHPYMPSPGPTANIFNNFKAQVSEYGFGDRIWVTEVGYPIYGSYGTEVAEEKMPETVLLTLTLLTVSGAERILWYELFDHGDAADKSDSENWFGLVNGDTFEKRKGAFAYQLYARNIPGRDCKIPERQGLSNSVRAYYFEAPGGDCALVLWNETVVVPRDVDVYLPGSEQRVYNIDTGVATGIGESSRYTLKEKDGENHYIRFFTWKNDKPAQRPRISG
jgi:hypothetical protein